MAKYIDSGEIVLLLDSYTQEGQYLFDSLKRAGYECIAIVINENDFLPEAFFSIYDLFIGNYIQEKKIKPRFFNEIDVPDYWSISAGVNENYGKISYQHEEKGKIHYAEIAKSYIVKAVDWYDRKGVTRFRDHYNRYGSICARTVYNVQGEPMSKTWLSEEGKEIIVENYITHDTILNDGEIVKIFRTKTDLVCYGFTKMGLNQKRIFFNSLSTPFFVSNALDGFEKTDILFWQEAIGDNIPGNMQMILDGKAKRTGKIIVQKRHVYNRLMELDIPAEMIYRLGFIYLFKKEKFFEPEALICTRSDEIEHCQEFIKALPQMHFHITAPTLMSSKLMNLDTYDNVSIYPAVKTQILEELFEKCGFYFDINYHTAVDSAIYQAFLHNQLVFAFQETIHNREFVADEHIYPVAEFEKMVADICSIINNDAIGRQHLKRQHEDALAENKKTYVKTLNV